MVHVSSSGMISVSPLEQLNDNTPVFGFATNVVGGSDQEVAFSCLAEELIDRLDEGFSCTLMAYGQTGSGKTYTMFGPTGSLTISSLDHLYEKGVVSPLWGILPRALMILLASGKASAKASGGGNTSAVTLHASAIEVYQGLAYDLLNQKQPLTVGIKVGKGRSNMGSGGGTANRASVAGNHPAGCRCYKCVKIKEEERDLMQVRKALRDGNIPMLFVAKGADPMKIKKMIRKVEAFDKRQKEGRKKKVTDKNGFATVGETLWKLDTPEDIMKLAREVEMSRTAMGHALNERSSRSHCLVHVHVVEKLPPNHLGVSKVRKKTLLVVDLAGSERIAKSQVQGVAKAQAIAINTSLTTLGRVIKALGSTAGSPKHVPYRDSTLTMLLRSSFGGKSCTSVVVNVASELQHLEESICSLQFGERLAVVQNTNVARERSEEMTDQAIKAQHHLLRRKKRELIQLEEQGKGAGFGVNANHGQVASFKATLEQLDFVNQELRKWSVVDKERGGGGENSKRVSKLEREKKTLEENIQNQKNAVDRLTKIKFWHKASPAWVAKDREIKELEAKIQLWSG